MITMILMILAICVYKWYNDNNDTIILMILAICVYKWYNDNNDN